MKKLIGLLLISLFMITAIFPSQVFANTNSWSQLALEKVGIMDLAVDPARSETLYAATTQGVQMSSDSGTTWHSINKGLPASEATSIAINPTNSKNIFVSYDGEGIFKSVDGGETWVAQNDGLPTLNVRTLVFHPKDSNTLYAGIKGGVCITNNAGSKWSPTSGFKPYTNVNDIAFNPQDPSTVYAATGNDGVFKSTNGGVSWKDINTGLPSMSVFTLSIDPKNPERIDAGTYNAVTPTDLYVGDVYGGVFYTNDGGAHWEASKALSSVTVFRLVRYPQNSNVIYASTLGGIYRSIDGGINWTDINAGLANEFLHALVLVPQKDAPLLLSGTPNGIYMYADPEWNSLKAKISVIPKWVWWTAGGTAGAILIGLVIWVILRKRRKGKEKHKYAW